MKQVRISRMHRGFQLEVVMAVKTKQDACKAFDCTMYEINTYASVTTQLIEECKKQPYVKFVSFNILSGELFYAKPEWMGKVLKYTDVINFIDEYRKVYKTYNDTIENHKLKKS